ncbi:MAG: hypothetical protein ACE3JP_12395 [Ectobacillus sp.]
MSSISFNMIEDLIAQGKETKALSLIEELEANGELDSQMKYMKGFAFFKIGLFPKAKRLLSEIPLSCSCYSAALSCLCMISWIEEGYDEAAALLKQLKAAAEHGGAAQKVWHTCSWVHRQLTEETAGAMNDIDEEWVCQLFGELLKRNKQKQADQLVPFLREVKDVKLQKQLLAYCRQYSYTSLLNQQQENPLLLAEELITQQSIPQARRLYKHLLKHHPHPDLIRLKLVAALLHEVELLEKLPAHPKMRQAIQAISALKAKLEASQELIQRG